MDADTVSKRPPTTTTRDQWNHFVPETIAPITGGVVASNAVFSQLTQADPQHGKASSAFAKRYRAAPEFWSDFRAHVFRRHHHDRPARSLDSLWRIVCPSAPRVFVALG